MARTTCTDCGTTLPDMAIEVGVEICDNCLTKRSRILEASQRFNGASDKQISFIQRLAEERKVEVDTNGMTKDEASSKIEELLAIEIPGVVQLSDDEKRALSALAIEHPGNGFLLAMVQKAANQEPLSPKMLAGVRKWTDRATKPAAERVTLEDGVYLVDGDVYKVKHNQAGTNQYASILVVEEGSKGRFEYAKGAMRLIKPEHRMDMDKAREFGALYGVCCNCGRLLTDERSIEAGIGPICAKRL